MRIRVRILLVLATLASVVLQCPAPASAVPALGLSWNSCSPLETAHPIVGADRVAHLVVFVQGLADSVSGFEVTVRIKSTPSYACACSGADATTVTPAWQFEPGGCQGPGRLAVEFATVRAGCVAPIGQPSFADFSTARDSAFCAPASCGTSNDLLTMRASRPQGWHFDPQVPTGLWSVNFDLSASCALGNGAGPCCTDDRPMALIVGGRAYALDGSPIDLGGGYVTYTASAVQTRPSSWGKLKAQYR